MILKCPVKHTVWGSINNIDDLKNAIAKSGQPFGVDWSGPACNINPAWPCDKTYYQYLGFGLHKGIDIPVATGTEVYASTSGKVVEISDDKTKGIGVVIYDESQHIKTLYWHLLSHSVALSDIIKVGQLIGISDNTGYSEGPHLHFELKTTDEHGISINSIDPMPYITFQDTMTQDEVEKIYVLAFYREPTLEESNFWVGKKLLDFLNTAITDRSKFLAQHEQSVL